MFTPAYRARIDGFIMFTPDYRAKIDGLMFIPDY